MYDTVGKMIVSELHTWSIADTEEFVLFATEATLCAARVKELNTWAFSTWNCARVGSCMTMNNRHVAKLGSNSTTCKH